MNNIIIVVVDAFRPKHLSMFNYKKETDKNLKKIAEESILFRQHFSTSNSTAPALTSIFTGLYCSNHGILHQFPYTKDEEIANFYKVKFWLPNLLRDKGYYTMAVDWLGMWFKNGFDYYEEKEENESKLKKFMNIPLIKKILLRLPNWAYKLGKKIVKTRASAPFSPTEETIELAISKIKQAKNPFFLFIHLWDTHFPFPNTNYKASGGNDIDEILKTIESPSQKEYIKKRITDISLYSTQDIINKYDLTIERIDAGIGRLHEFLKKQGLWQDTIFIVLGDHGDSLTEHKVYFDHSGLFDVSIHTPLIMHIPGIEHKEVNELIQNVDIVPTILEILGEKTKGLDGVSLLPLIKEGKKIRDKVFLVDGLAHDIKAVRTDSRKLIVANDNTCHLCNSSHHEKFEEYDLVKDPDEKKNIYSGKSELMEFLE